MAIKILLVEDNQENREMLSIRLESKGYEVIGAGTGKKAIELALTNPPPHIILMDLSLPEMDGWEATRQLKKNIQTKNIPVIALTAHAMRGDRENALKAGCDDYDTKPIDFPRLLGKIQKYTTHL